MKSNKKISVTRMNTGFICAESIEFGILKVEGWLKLNASLIK